MNIMKCIIKKVTLIIIMISILITFFATPASYAKLDLKEGDFYYSGTTQGRYTVKDGIFSWLLNNLGDIVDWLLGITTLMIRMVFVGWTALIEKLLTWALESTTGLDLNGTAVDYSSEYNGIGTLKVDTTDLTKISDSSRNVTVEAIVYNKVPALDINFFKLNYDRTLSGTGQKLVCKTCNQDVELCVTSLNEDSNIDLNTIDMATICSCECGGCDSCVMYVQQLAVEEPLIIKLRGLVATWYNIIRLIAMAAMLLVLIVVAIKMAISTVASDKAVYKRMLFDWLVGLIMLFTIHYFMVFVINLNDVFISVIQETSNGINSIAMKQLSETEITNPEIELKVYEQVRTRAYDPKLLNGISGTIMYMTLVYMAVRYTVIYLKRYLTILVLTLMAPAVGVSYALQKVFSGKSHALKTWMTEYIMNIIIQIVHALLYAIFISQAMILSLQSVAGIFIALILMNYTMKADELFKKIFKFGGGDSLLGHTEGALEALQKNMGTVKGIVTGAKPVKDMLMNNPYGLAVRAAGRAVVAGGILGVGKLTKNYASTTKDTGLDEATYNAKVDEEMDENFGGSIKGFRETDAQYNARRAKAEGSLIEKGIFSNKGDKELLQTGKHALEKDVKKSLEEYEQNPASIDAERKYKQAHSRFARYTNITTPTTGQIIKAHAKKAVSLDDIFKANSSKSKKENTKAMLNGFLGTIHWNNKERKFVVEKDAAIDQLSVSELLGFSAEDKKAFKQNVLDPIKSGFIGMGSLFLGFGTVVANPSLGFMLIGQGISKSGRVFRKPTNMGSYTGKYTYARYGVATMAGIHKNALAQAKREADALTANNIRKRHPGLAKSLLDGGTTAITLGTISGVGTASLVNGAIMTGIGAVAGTAANLGMRYTAANGYLEAMDLQAKKQQEKQEKQFAEEALQIMTIQTAAELTRQQRLMDDLSKTPTTDINEETKAILEEMGIDIDTDGNIKEKVIDKGDGYELSTESGGIIVKETIEIQRDADGKVIAKNRKIITDTDVKTVYKEIDILVNELIAENVDFTDKKKQNKAIEKLSDRLASIGILVGDQDADVLFKGGKKVLVGIFKEKTKKVQKAHDILEQRLPASTNAEKVTNIINDLMKSGKSIQKIHPKDITDKMGTLSEDEKRQIQVAVAEYINSVRPGANIIQKASKIARERTGRKKSNLQDAVAMLVGVELEKTDYKENPKSSDEVLDDLLRKRKSASSPSDKIVLDNGVKRVELTKVEADAVTGMVKKLLEVKAANIIADKPLDIKNSTKAYVKAKNEKSTLSVKRYKKEIELLRVQNGEIIERYDPEIKKERKVTEEELREELEILTKKLEAAKVKQKLVGPIFDINDFVVNQMERR